MSFEERINSDLKNAMLKKNDAALRGIRAIKSAILLAKTEKGATKEFDDEAEIKLLQKLLKQRRDSLEIFEKENRHDLANKEREEIEIISRYLPEQIDAADLRTLLKKIIEEVGAKTPQDMGKVMNAATKQLSGRADGKTISLAVKELLANG